MAMTEAQILKQIKINLRLFCPSVIWVDRLQAGKREIEGRWIQMGKAGTPDLYAIIKEDGGHIFFIEVKREGGRQSDEQKTFEKMIEGLDHVHYILAYSFSDVINNIKKVLDKP